VPEAPSYDYRTVQVGFEDGIAWVTLNRPEKRNAVSAEMATEMVDVVDKLEIDDRCQVFVLTGAGESFCAGMDLRDYFRSSDADTAVKRARLYRTNGTWQWRRLLNYPKPTIAMVNGWCFGGAFTPVIACDIAVAADEATFGLSEINWGIIPAGIVSKALSTVVRQREALYYVMTGETFDGKRAAQIGMVTESVPLARLRQRTVEIARVLMKKNPNVLRQAKTAFKYGAEMPWDAAGEYLMAKSDQTTFNDPERGREKGMGQFLDEKSYKPGLAPYRRDD